MHSNTNSPIHLPSDDHIAYQVMGILGICSHETNPLTTWVMYVGYAKYHRDTVGGQDSPERGFLHVLDQAALFPSN